MSAAAEMDAIWHGRNNDEDSVAALLWSRCPESYNTWASVLCRLYGKGAAVKAEVARVQAAGGWVSDGRVCDVLAVSRAFGDRNFKGDGLEQLVARGIECVPAC